MAITTATTINAAKQQKKKKKNSTFYFISIFKTENKKKTQLNRLIKLKAIELAQ